MFCANLCIYYIYSTDMSKALHKQLPVQEGLFDWPAERPRLIGSVCNSCGNAEFPFRPFCNRCMGGRVTSVLLPETGRLWTWTVQRFMPKPPYQGSENKADFVPFGVGYIALGGEHPLKVESRLLVNDCSTLRIGMAMRLRIVKLRESVGGTEVMCFAFEPDMRAGALL